MSNTTRLVRLDAIRRDMRRLESATLVNKIAPAQSVLMGLVDLVENICDALETHERDLLELRQRAGLPLN